MVIVEKVDKKKLKTGFTTGTSATAAAKAALLKRYYQMNRFSA